MVKAKYQDVLDLGEQLNIKDGKVEVDNDKLKVWGTAATQYEKNLLWDKIKEIGGENPSDIMADIKVEDESVYARHTVKSGDTFGTILDAHGVPAQTVFNITNSVKETFNPPKGSPSKYINLPNLS